MLPSWGGLCRPESIAEVVPLTLYRSSGCKTYSFKACLEGLQAGRLKTALGQRGCARLRPLFLGAMAVQWSL